MKHRKEKKEFSQIDLYMVKKPGTVVWFETKITKKR